MVAMPRSAEALGSLRKTCVPLSSIDPESGCNAPLNSLSRVDLPAPFSPTRACTSPGRSSKSTSLSARTPGKLLDTASSLRGLAAPDGAAAGSRGGTPGGPVALSGLLRKARDILFGYEGNIHDVAFWDLLALELLLSELHPHA